MPFNGSNGTFNRLYSWTADAAAEINILAARMDAEMNGFAAGLSNCVTRDGQSPPSTDLPMGGKKLVNLGTPTVPTDAATKAYADGLVAGGPFAPLAGANFTGAVIAPTFTAIGASSGAVTLTPGDATHTGYLAFFTPANVRQGYVGFALAGGAISYNNDTANGHVFSGGGLTSNGGITSLTDIVMAGTGRVTLASSGDITAYRSDGTGVIYLGSSGTRYLYNDGANMQVQAPGGNLIINGAAAYHTGNFNPAAYAALSGAAFSGQVNAPTFAVGANTYFTVSGGNPIMNWGPNTYTYLDAASNKRVWVANGSAFMSLDAAGTLRVAGNIIAGTTV